MDNVQLRKSLLFLVVCDINIENFEEKALKMTKLKPSAWLRYTNDTVILWFHQDNVQDLLDHMNSLWPLIHFTQEV